MSGTEIEHIDGVPIAHVRHDIDAATVAEVQTQLDQAVGPDALSLIVDLSDTGYIDSAGIDMLLRLNERLSQRRTKLMLVISPQSQLHRLFHIVGLEHTVAIHVTMGEALHASAQFPKGAAAPEGTLETPNSP
jgi:anti-anti-sigma factor